MDNKELIFKENEIVSKLVMDINLLVDKFNFTILSIEKLCNLEEDRLSDFINTNGLLNEEEFGRISDVVFELNELIQKYYVNKEYAMG